MQRRIKRFRRIAPNLAQLWLVDPAKADVTLTQARAVSFGIGRLQLVTREGVRVLLSQAAGIVISLLAAFSLVALLAAGTMLAAGAHADVQRRLSGLGVLVVVALADPEPRTGFIDRAVAAAYDAGIEPLLCLTKADLAPPDPLVPRRTVSVCAGGSFRTVS